MKSGNLLRKLHSLFWGELLSCIMFPILYFMWTDFSVAKLNLTTIFNLFILAIILLEGALYWRLILNKIRGIRVVNRYVVGKIYHIFKIINIVLLIFSAVVIIFTLTTSTKYQIAVQLILYFFSLVEYVNYFHIRLSYYGKKKRFFQIIKPLKILFIKKKKTKSHIAKDIIYYKNNK